MAYSSAQAVLGMVKGEMLRAILGGEYIEDEAEVRRMALPYAEAAIGDADAEIDGYLAKRYHVPLVKVPKVICKISKDIAVYNLFARTGINEDNQEKTILNRYNAAIAYLTNVAKGIVDIMEEDRGTGGIQDGSTTGSSGFRTGSNQRIFTRDKMRGW